MIKFLICPGEVVSKKDGDVHYIGAAQLRTLYRVDPAECVVNGSYKFVQFAERQPEAAKKLIALRPSFDGNYEAPKGYFRCVSCDQILDTVERTDNLDYHDLCHECNGGDTEEGRTVE